MNNSFFHKNNVSLTCEEPSALKNSIVNQNDYVAIPSKLPEPKISLTTERSQSGAQFPHLNQNDYIIISSKLPEPKMSPITPRFESRSKFPSKQIGLLNYHLNNNKINFQTFVDAGFLGGKVSQHRSQHRENLICELISATLLIEPTDFRLSAVSMAYLIHDSFEKTIQQYPDKYGNSSSFGSQDRSLSKPYLDYLTTRIRKLVKKHKRELRKYSSKIWDPAPDPISTKHP